LAGTDLLIPEDTTFDHTAIKHSGMKNKSGHTLSPAKLNSAIVVFDSNTNDSIESIRPS
jgi:hypothetical protein